MLVIDKGEYGMKTILVVSPTGSLDNGAEISILQFMKAAMQEGHTVYNAFPTFYLENKTEYITQLKEAGIESVALPSMKWWWEDAPGGLPGTKKERTQSYKENIATLREVIRQKNIDVVVTNTVNMFQGAVAASCEGVAHIWLIHEMPTGEFGYYKDRMDFIEQYSSAVFAVEGGLRTRLQELVTNDCEVQPFIPYTHLQTRTLQSSQTSRFVCVGRITKRKNQLELIQAFHQLGDNSRELILIGHWDEDYKKQCDAYIRQHHVQGVRFLGYKENPWEEVTDADICVFPSSMETYGLVYIEAVLNGIPTILSDNVGHLAAYQLCQTGMIYPTGDIAVLKQCMNESLAQFSIRKEKALKDSKEVEKKYTPGYAYSDLLACVNKRELSPKPIVKPIAALFEVDEKERITNGQLFIRKVKNKLKRILSR